MEEMLNEVQDRVGRWFASEVATQGKTIRVEKEVLPDHDVHAVITPRHDFDMAMLKSGDQDLAGWAREAVHALVTELPDGAIVTPPCLQGGKESFMVKAWLALHVMTPNDQAETSERSDDSSPAPCSASDRRNERKAYHVATTASSLVWGGEHGWERDEVGEYDLAHALRKYIRDLKKQNAELSFKKGAKYERNEL